MKYKIMGDALPAVNFLLDAGDKIRVQAGGMTWMTNDIDMDAEMHGGIAGGLGRMISGESLFLTTFTSHAPNQELNVSSTFPGTIVPVQLDGNMNYICQKQAYLCSTMDVDLSIEAKFNMSGFFGGEGFILQKLSGRGMAFLELDGYVVERTLAPGEKMKVSTGNLALYEASVKYDVETVKGVKNMFFGGEGIFITVLEGPGKIWLQTMDMMGFAGRISPYLPKTR